MGNLVQSRWVKFFAHATPNTWYTSTVSNFAPPACPCTNGALVSPALPRHCLIRDGTLEPMVAADLDLVNMFGNAEWPSIRSAIQSHFEEALPWTKWHHEQPSTTVLPCKTDFDTDRGAEQGDVLGSIQSSLTLGAARSQHFARVGDRTFYPGACDEWYIDDGQAFVRPHLFDAWLHSVDAALRSFGATRGSPTQP